LQGIALALPFQALLSAIDAALPEGSNRECNGKPHAILSLSVDKVEDRNAKPTPSPN
jgi:hypothetical protein